MALQRDTLRDELVAMIAAGRELSPEHDYELADVFLHTVQQRLRMQPPAPTSIPGQEQMRYVMAAVGLALAALVLSAAALLSAGHTSGMYYRHAFMPSMYFRAGSIDPDHDRWGQFDPQPAPPSQPFNAPAPPGS